MVLRLLTVDWFLKITEAQGQRKAVHWKPQDIESNQVAAADSDLQQKEFHMFNRSGLSGQENTKLASHKRHAGWLAGFHLAQSKFFQRKKRSLAARYRPSPATIYENLRQVMLSSCAIILAYRRAERMKLIMAAIGGWQTCVCSAKSLSSAKLPAALVPLSGLTQHPYVDSIIAWEKTLSEVDVLFPGTVCFCPLPLAPWNVIVSQGPFRSI